MGMAVGAASSLVVVSRRISACKDPLVLPSLERRSNVQEKSVNICSWSCTGVVLQQTSTVFIT